jgi:hypothetical protein
MVRLRWRKTHYHSGKEIPCDRPSGRVEIDRFPILERAAAQVPDLLGQPIRYVVEHMPLADFAHDHDGRDAKAIGGPPKNEPEFTPHADNTVTKDIIATAA